MKSSELLRILKQKGCEFKTHKGGSGHITVRKGNRSTVLPIHGNRQELSKSIYHKILKDSGIDIDK